MVCDHPDVQSCLSLAGIDWNFNLEKAPWWGGLFERMIRSMKRCLRKVSPQGGVKSKVLI